MKRIVLILSFALAMLATACQQGPAGTPTPTPGASKPNVVIVAPASNASVTTGTTVQIQSTSADANGIVLVELIVDGQTLQNSPTPNGQPQPQFSVIQSWTATTPGTHTLTVKATNAKLGTGDASITLNVAQQIAQATQTLVVQTSTPLPQTAVAPTGVAPTGVPATPSGPTTCTLAATFINDVTIPDGTTVAPGGSFVKTWAIQNSGTCAWGGGYNVVLVDGQPFGASSPQPIPAAGAGDTINISVNMVAPTTPGAASSVWQIQASNGITFGAKFDAVINVPGAATPQPPPTLVPPTPIPSGCNGAPVLSTFSANPQTITAGQQTALNWGLVQNASAVYLTSPSGTQAVGTPGSTTVQPTQTTTYTLTAYCNNIPNQIQLTVIVNGSGGVCTGNNTPVFNGFYANPQTISAGEQTTLSWGLVSNATAVYLQFPDKSIGVGSPGSRTVKPGGTTTYTLVAYCGNNQASLSVTVNVNGGCSGTPNFNGFSAHPTTINKGQSSTLSWGFVSNATSVVLKTPDGNSGVGTPGQISVSPQATTTYTLVAYCYNTSIQTTVTVTVNNPQPTPTPTVIPEPNKVFNITANWLGNQKYQLAVEYYWNNTDPPAVIEVVGLSKDGKIVTTANSPSATPYQRTNTGILIRVKGNRVVVKFHACIVGRSGATLACKNVPAPP